MKRKFLDADAAIDILIRDGVKAASPVVTSSDEEPLLMAEPNPYSEQAQRAIGNDPGKGYARKSSARSVKKAT
eukprot:8089141-Prorocentrum_lima.AAC.1